MSRDRRRFLKLIASVVAAASPRLVRAQAFPARPVTIVVPTAAGAQTDSVGRILAEGMQRSLGQSVAIQNVVGANGSIAARRVAAAPADGYTLILGGWSTHVANGAIYSLPYDLLSDFEPVSLVAKNPQLIAARKAMNGDDLRSSITWLKANPDIASAGNSGVGGAGHLYSLLFKQETATRFVIAPYQGSARAMQDLESNQIDLLFDNVLTILPRLNAGAIKAYAVTSDSRIPKAPNVPTVAEAGFPGLRFSAWSALFAPKGTPKEVIAKLNAAVAASLSDSSTRGRLVDLALELPPPEQQAPDALRALQKADIDKWWPIITAANIKVQ